MLSWMLYSIVVSLLMGLATLALERSAQIRQRPARWLWATCMVASLAIPFIPSKVSVQIPETAHANRAKSSEILTPPQPTAIETSRFKLPIIGTDPTPLSNGVSTVLDWTWRVSSVALALVILASGAHLSWRRRRWDRGHMAGTAVYISEDSGPAVVGFLRPHIVVPRWLTKLSPGEQELVIAHERSHLDAYDTQLLTIAVCLLACMPWNLMLWWQLRRLRLAIEIDCDARVLSLGYPVARYSETLIAVGERQSASYAMTMARFGPKSFLEQTIHNMLRKQARLAPVTALASMLCRRPSSHDVAMTGELTLRGRILTIGGLKEKLTAAARAGVKTVLVPARNQSDIVDVPDEVKQLLEIKPVETIDEVLELALLEPHPLRPVAVRARPSGQTEARP